MQQSKDMNYYIKGVRSYAAQFDYNQWKQNAEFMYELADYLESLPYTDTSKIILERFEALRECACDEENITVRDILADLEEERIMVKTAMYKYQSEGCEFMAAMGRGKHNGIAYAINLIISKMGIKNYEGVKYE